jgi:hypothetical protein
MKVAGPTAAGAHHQAAGPADLLLADTVLADTVLVHPRFLMYAIPVCRSYTLCRYVVHHDLYGV